jgi:hypothetical protein
MPTHIALSSPVLSRPLRLLLASLLYSTSTTTVVALAFDSPNATTMSSTSLIVATRLHLGQSASPPADLDQKVAGFYKFCSESCPPGSMGVLAVDATPKIPGYDLVQAVQAACDKATTAASPTTTTTTTTRLHVLPVTPWGKFVPALNALVQFAAASQPLHDKEKDSCHQILFCSAETSCSAQAVRTLQSHLQDDTAVVGACLPGHDYQSATQCSTTADAAAVQQQQQQQPVIVPLNGRTSPWNTLALWDLRKLALTGFLPVSDGLLSDDATDPSFGIEEVVATCLLQKLLGADQAKSKLVQLTTTDSNDDAGVDWNQSFDDPERKKWHEQKMKSKLTRAARQLELTGLSGVVHHC